MDRREAEEALRASEAKFAAAFQTAGILMAISRTRDGRILEVNDAFCAAVGLDRSEIVGKTTTELALYVNESDRDRLVSEVLAHGSARDVEIPIRIPDGTTGYASFSVSLIDVAGERCFLVAAIDISSRRRAEEALRASEERYRMLVEQTADGVLLLGDDLTILDANPALAEILGRPIDELRGTCWTDYIDPQDLADVPPPLSALEAGKPIVFERRLSRPDGSIVDVEVHARQFAPGRILGTARDIGARKAAECERARLIQAIEQSAESIVITEPDGALIYVNQTFEKTTGHKRQEVLGRSPRFLRSDAHGPDFYESIWATLAEAGTWSGEIQNRREDGSLLRQAVTVSAVRDSTGNLVNYVAVQRDITRERDLEEQLRQAQKMEAVGRLAGGVAHDFNNLLTAILGFTELATEEAPPGSELVEYLNEIRRSADRATGLTRQLLAFGRRAVLQPQVLDLNKVVVELAPMLTRIIGEDVELVVKTDPALGHALADRGQLEQVVVNVAANARDAMPTGGRLVIETSNVRLDEQYVTEHPEVAEGDYVRLSMTDSGAGMDAETVEHIFEPFFTTKGAGRGTGLGLATVFGIVRQSGGHIGVRSAPGQGSTFAIDLPQVDSGVELVGTEPASAGVSTEGRETVLVVEDEPTVLGFAAQLLERNGYTVLRASSGAEAVRLSRTHADPIDLIFSDLVMPGLTGQETAAAVRASRPEIRQLFTSGYSEETNAQRGVVASGFPFIEKPYAADALLRAVREVLEGDRTG